MAFDDEFPLLLTVILELSLIESNHNGVNIVDVESPDTIPNARKTDFSMLFSGIFLLQEKNKYTRLSYCHVVLSAIFKPCDQLICHVMYFHFSLGWILYNFYFELLLRQWLFYKVFVNVFSLV